MTPKLSFAFGLVSMFGILVAFTAVASADDVETYQRALSQVCRTGVTPALNAQYQGAVAAVDREAVVEDYTRVFPTIFGLVATPSKRVLRVTTNPHGQTTNSFWSPTPPDLGYANCWQAP